MHLVKLLIVDDHKMIRHGLRAMLRNSERVQIVSEADNGQQALEFMADQPVDLTLMDIDMPVLNGIETTRRIKQDYPTTKVLALSMHNEEEPIIGMLQAGASGYILKTSGHKILIEAINRLLQGEHYFPKEVAAVVYQQFSRSKAMQHNHSNAFAKELSPRETEVLRLIAQEYSNPEIADKLFISPRTVDTHRYNLLLKLKLKNTAGLVKYAVKHNIANL